LFQRGQKDNPRGYGLAGYTYESGRGEPLPLSDRRDYSRDCAIASISADIEALEKGEMQILAKPVSDKTGQKICRSNEPGRIFTSFD
jgi:hypothetical protein